MWSCAPLGGSEQPSLALPWLLLSTLSMAMVTIQRALPAPTGGPQARHRPDGVLSLEQHRSSTVIMKQHTGNAVFQLSRDGDVSIRSQWSSVKQSCAPHSWTESAYLTSSDTDVYLPRSQPGPSTVQVRNMTRRAFQFKIPAQKLKFSKFLLELECSTTDKHSHVFAGLSNLPSLGFPAVISKFHVRAVLV